MKMIRSTKRKPYSHGQIYFIDFFFQIGEDAVFIVQIKTFESERGHHDQLYQDN